MYGWSAKAWMILYRQNDLNLLILCMFKVSFSLDNAQMMTTEGVDLAVRFA